MKCLVVVSALAMLACTSEESAGDAAIGRADGGGADSSAAQDMARRPGPDAGAPDAAAPDAGPSSELPCSFNRECPASERCLCDEATGCLCQRGPRGMGQNGVDACTSGDDCASALCLEGPGGALLCSDECVDDQDCPAALPMCLDVAFVGRVCVRTTPP